MKIIVKNITENKNVTYSGDVFMCADEDGKVPFVYASCPSCSGDIYKGSVSCPDNKSGCLVAHYGYGCKDCLKAFDLQIEYDPPLVPGKINWKVKEKIGVAIINPRGVKQGRI